MDNALKRSRIQSRGFTLVEVLIAMAVTALIMGAFGAIVYQVFRVNDSSGNNTLAFRQVQYAGQYISKDVLQAQDIKINVPGTVLFVSWDYTPAPYNQERHTIGYVLQGDKKLIRYDYVGIPPDPITWGFGYTSRIVVADFVTNFVFVFDGLTYELKVTATVGTGTNAATETRTYKIEPRIDPTTA